MTISAGTIIPYGGSSAPSGFLLCDGSAVSRSTYSTLFGVISTTFGSGDGSTTFNLPDLRGRVVAGKDNMGGSAANRLTSTTMTPDGVTLGATGGEETHTLVTSEMPSHTHRLWSTSGGGSGSTVAGFGSTSVSTVCGLIPIGGSNSYYDTFQAGHAVMEATGGDGAHDNVQPTLILNYIIATQDVSGTGTVTSVAMTGDGVIFDSTVSGSPVTTSGTLAPSLLTQTANTVLAGPTSGGAATPTFRALGATDLPNTAVTPGSYTIASITVDAQGRITAASSGSAGTVTSVGLSTDASWFTVGSSPVTTNGTITINKTGGLTANQVLATPDGTTGTVGLRSLVGADLPNPSSSSLGGVQSYAAVANQWINAISTSGVPASSQPAFSNISGTIAAGQLPTNLLLATMLTIASLRG